MAIPCGCENDPGAHATCGHYNGEARCRFHPDREAVARNDGDPMCAECWDEVRACADHPEHPGAIGDDGLPLCPVCVLNDSGAREAIASWYPRARRVA